MCLIPTVLKESKSSMGSVIEQLTKALCSRHLSVGLLFWKQTQPHLIFICGPNKGANFLQSTQINAKKGLFSFIKPEALENILFLKVRCLGRDLVLLHCEMTSSINTPWAALPYLKSGWGLGKEVMWSRRRGGSGNYDLYVKWTKILK